VIGGGAGGLSVRSRFLCDLCDLPVQPSPRTLVGVNSGRIVAQTVEPNCPCLIRDRLFWRATASENVDFSSNAQSGEKNLSVRREACTTLCSPARVAKLCLGCILIGRDVGQAKHSPNLLRATSDFGRSGNLRRQQQETFYHHHRAVKSRYGSSVFGRNFRMPHGNSIARCDGVRVPGLPIAVKVSLPGGLYLHCRAPVLRAIMVICAPHLHRHVRHRLILQLSSVHWRQNLPPPRGFCFGCLVREKNTDRRRRQCSSGIESNARRSILFGLFQSLFSLHKGRAVFTAQPAIFSLPGNQ